VIENHESALDDIPARSCTRAWWLVAGLLVCAFLARGPLYLAVFPPFEGWDEYQHLAYLVHLDEKGTLPLYDSRVSLALRPLVMSMPHSPSGAEQVKEWGAVSYAEYWNAPSPTPATAGPALSSPRLYQSQHPPLAYAVALPVWRALDPLVAIYALRMMNLIVVAAALGLFAAALERLVPSFAPRVAVLALVCLHPLFFQNVARVANDALAVATGLAGISLLVLADGRTLTTRGLLATALIAASVWSKQTSLTLIPALAVGLPAVAWAHRVSAGRMMRVTGIAGAFFLVLVAPLWIWNYQHYGTLLTTQDSVELAARGSAVAALRTSFTTVPWWQVIDALFVPGRAWVGGWSFLPMQDTLDDVYRWYWSTLLAAAAAGGVVASVRRMRSHRSLSRVGSDDGTWAGLLVCASVVIFTALGMSYHVVLSHAVFGRPMTNTWYFMTALPCLFVLVVRGLESIDRRLGTASVAVLAVLFVVIDLHGTWVQMPSFYANTTDPTLQWSRLTAIHPAILSGDMRWLFLAVQVGVLGLAIAGWLRVSRRREYVS
jgi:hypothetical protein